MELLVVFLIIGVLAAVALPTVLGQREKGHDASAKANARNLVSDVESCFVRSEDYRQCDNSQLDATGLPLSSTDGATPPNGEVSVESVAQRVFTVAARSVTGTIFRISRSPSGGYTRSCTPDGGICHDGTW
jgi:type IV pilus assembly protein PilA